MGIFDDIVKKLRGESAASTTAATTASSGPKPKVRKPDATGTLKDVDVEAVLAQMAAKKGGGGNYKVSIVDLLKLLDMESSLAARTKLAGELGVNAGPHGSAEQNIALHKAVLKKLAENGGKVPESLKD